MCFRRRILWRKLTLILFLHKGILVYLCMTAENVRQRKLSWILQPDQNIISLGCWV